MMSRILTLALVLSCGANAFAKEPGGFAEWRFSLMPGVDGDDWQFIERLRPSFDVAIGERMALVATIEAALSQGRDLSREFRRTIEESDLGPFLELADCTWPERRNQALGIDGAADYLDVDRLYLDIYGAWADIRIGRQSINWGSAQFLNPTDPFPEVLFAEPWRPRRGVNALRANIPIGAMNDLTAVVATDDIFKQTRAALRLRINWLQTDWAMVGAWRSDNKSGLLGIDLRGTLGVGWWFEGAVTFADGERNAALTAGIDYSFPVLERLMLSLQYHRNQNGATHPDDYAQQGGLTGVALPSCDAIPAEMLPAAGDVDPFAPFTRARDYLMLGGTIAVDEDLSGSLFWMQNLNDGSAMAVPSVNFLAHDRLEFALTVQLPLALWGDGGEFKPRAQDLYLDTPLGIGADLAGLVPDATVVFWTRLSY